MAIAAILPVVSRSSALALELYRVAAESPEAAKGLVGVANQINGFALILKQVGTIIKEDDLLPSPQVRLVLHKHEQSSPGGTGKTKTSKLQSQRGLILVSTYPLLESFIAIY
jgi:hypothetical protein